MPLLLALVLFSSAVVPGAFAQQLIPGAQAPTSQGPLAGAPPPVPAPPPPGAATTAPLPPVAVDWGLCQCIGDKQSLDFTCPGSAEACKSACGNQFSFKPDARCRQADAAH